MPNFNSKIRPSRSAQTSTEYALMVFVIMSMVGAFQLFTDDTTTLGNRNTLQLMFDNTERAVTRGYP